MFTERLSAALELTIAGTAHAVKGGDVKHLRVRMTPWGFRAEVEFWLVAREQTSEDSLFSAFVGKDLVKAKLSLARTLDDVEESPTTLVVKGIVTERVVEERTVPGVQGAPVLQRLYRVHFADAGQVLWSQHFPKALYVGKKWQDVVNGNLPQGVTVTWSWSAATTKTFPVLSLALDEDTASFHDFVVWLADTRGAGIFYSVADDSYAFRDAKPEASSPTALRIEEVAVVTTTYPRVRRATVTVLNAYSEAATKTQDVTNADAVQGVKEHHLVRSQVGSVLTDRVTLETTRSKQGEPGVRLALARFPADALRPNAAISLGEGFSTALAQNGKTYRTTFVDIEAKAADTRAGDATADVSNTYEIDYRVEAELAADPVMRLPAYRTPVWPMLVEGKVLSETGADDELTYQVYTEEQTSLDTYKVKIPVFADQKVIVPFEPTSLSGHFYFPLYRDERVLVALHFDHARVVEYLDWRAGARLPLDSQGNHLLVGKKGTDQTSVRHVYVDAKPELTIERKKDEDLQTIKVSEGTILIKTE